MKKVDENGGEKKRKKNKMGEEKGGQKRMIKVLFWNVRGLKKKDTEFWDYIKEFDVVAMTETWIEEEGWMKIEKEMPEEFRWKCQGARRERKKGRARGGIITGIREQIKEEEIQEEGMVEGMMERRIVINGEKWRISTVYSSGMKKIKEMIDERWGSEEREINLMGGDFNARVGEKGARNWEDRRDNARRNTKDKIENQEGRILMRMLEERGWEILNGNKEGDQEGEYTYANERGASVIDYAMVNEEGWNAVRKFRVGERTESDHMPLEIVIGRGEEKKKNERSKKRRCVRSIWDEEGRKEYEEKMEKKEYRETEVEKMMEEIKVCINEATKKKEWIKTEEGKRRNEWWSSECGNLKKEMKRELRRWRENEGSRQEYMTARKKFRKKCKECKEHRRMEEEEIIKSIKKEEEVWKYINKERKKNENISEKISMEEWKGYFMELLEGSNEKDKREREENREEDLEEITEEEIERQIERLKKKKAAGVDGLENEVWMYGGRRTKKRLGEIINRVWKGEGMPSEWRESVICPIYKKGSKNEVGNYRGVNLLCTAYKVYAMCLGEKLMKEAEEKGLIQDGQAGFRRGRGTMDNVYTMQHVVERELKKKAGKVYTLFVDLKAAFDRVDRKKLCEYLREKGVNEWLVRKIEEIYRETRNRVKVREQKSECFWTGKGVRQGCPLSPILFIVFLGDIDEWLSGAQNGGMVIGRKKVWTLAYADDLMMWAGDERGMRGMIKSLEKYMERKRLEVNVGKTKILVFGKGGRKRKEDEWMWKNEVIEKVKEFKYLGYVFNERGTWGAQVRELVKKANKVMGIVWGIGERKFGHDYGRRMSMFDSLVKSVLMYGVEIWGWKEHEEMERVQERYVRWVLGVDRETPGYIVREETKREKLRVDAGKRAMSFEEKIDERYWCEILRECMREKTRDRENDSTSEKVKYYVRNGYACEEVLRMRTEGIRLRERLSDRDRDVDRQERRARIKESRYNDKYEKSMTENLPKYLERESMKEKKMIARFRCGNEERECKFWMEERNRVCRMCGEGRETVEHMLKECEEMKGTDIERKEVLNEDGRGLEWMKNVERVRKRVEGREQGRESDK